MGSKKPRKASDDDIWFAPRGSFRVKLRKIKEGLCKSYNAPHRMFRIEHKRDKYHDVRIVDYNVEHLFVYNRDFVIHRDDGPAIYNNYDDKESNCKFYFNGFHITKLSQYAYLCDMDEMDHMMMALKYGEDLQ